MEDLSGTYKNIESGLRLLLEMETDNLDAGKKNEVVGFIDVREYGLALETLSAILHDDHRPIALGTTHIIQTLANTMHIHDNQAINSFISDLPKETHHISL